MRWTRLKQLRLERNILQVELAARAGIDRSRLSLIENGHLVPKADEARRLASVLGVDVGTLTDIAA